MHRAARRRPARNTHSDGANLAGTRRVSVNPHAGIAALATGDDAERARLLGEAQRLIAQESPNVFLYQPQWVSVANAKLKGLWKDVPIFANDLSLLYWE